MTALPRFFNPAMRFFTSNIQSLPGAKLYFTAAGSSTPKVVYQDKDGATPHADPVVANSYGIFPAIFLDGLYKAELKNSAGITQSGWPIDNIGADDPVPPFASWDSTFSYDLTANSFATGSDGFYYQVIQVPNLNKNPISQSAYWKKVELLQTWNASIDYADDVIVIYQGKMYASNVTPNLNHAPPNLSYWDNISFNNSVVGAFTATDAITGASLNTAGNLNFTTTANRIKGDLTTSTHANRVLFQTSTASSSSYLGIIPSGGPAAAGFYSYAESDPDNSAYLLVQSVGATGLNSITSNKNGTGTIRPVLLSVGATTGHQLQTSGNLTCGTTTDNTSGNKRAIVQLAETSTSGIYLGNTANTATNVLDWYEEGTFTPTGVGGTVAGAGTYGGFDRVGVYTRIGDIVYISLNIGWSAHTGTGELRISGLPFSTSNAHKDAFSVSCYNYAFGAGKQLTASTNGTGTSVYLWLSDPAGGSLLGAPMDTTLNSLFITGTYKV